MNKPWYPTPIERKCLQQLDTPNSWTILRTDPPEPEDILPWRPFRVVFFFNLVLFVVVLVGLFVVLEVVGDPSGFREDAPYGLAISLVLAAGFSLYATHLYRRSWNRRARWLRQRDD